jgi:hypothetical protein
MLGRNLSENTTEDNYKINACAVRGIKNNY